MSDANTPAAAPLAARPYMPGYGILAASEGSGLLPWAWAQERLEKAENYFFSTTRPDGRPHTMPVWGVWLADRFWYSTGARSRKARNLETNPNCAISIDLGTEALIVEGIDSFSTDADSNAQFCAAYGPKYHWDMDGFSDPVHIVQPRVVFAFKTGDGEFSRSATRWVFTSNQ
jgi:pyridoxamine 5'-phosphate oxidase-like protein